MVDCPTRQSSRLVTLAADFCVGKQNMIQIARIIIVTFVIGWLAWILGRTLVDGLRTGKIRHTDSKKRCDRKKNPLGYKEPAGSGLEPAGSGLVYLDYFGKMVQCQVQCQVSKCSLLVPSTDGCRRRRRIETMQVEVGYTTVAVDE